ncbi:MAG TPA: sulfurtransferase complex subunit TusB [Burkholderiales bacterium]|nr:sulfurtransferase complex subunit TusB [Burkholderiales bacterium]
MSSSASNGKSMLHVVNKSPLERKALDTCLRVARPGSGVLLIEDGIFAAVKGTAAATSLKQADGAGVTVYALWPDVEARGMQDRILDGVKMVDYGGFVDLVAEHATVQSWL